MCNLERLVESVIRRQHSINRFFRAANSKIAVQLYHRDTARDRFDAVYLDLVIILRRNTGNCESKEYNRG